MEDEAPVSETEEKNKALVRRFLEAMAKGDLAAMDEMMAPDFVDSSLLPGQEPDREGFKRSVVENLAPFSDVNNIIDEQVAEGDKVMTWGTVSMTHDRGPMMGIAPTGKRTTHAEVTLHRIVGGKIVEERSLADYLRTGHKCSCGSEERFQPAVGLRAPFVVTVEQSQLVDKHRPQREARRVGFSLGGHRLVSLKEDFEVSV